MNIEIGDWVRLTCGCKRCSGDRTGNQGVVTIIYKDKLGGISGGTVNLEPFRHPVRGMLPRYKEWNFCENCVSHVHSDQVPQNREFIWPKNRR